MLSKTVWSCKLPFILKIWCFPLQSFWLINSFSLYVSFYTQSDKQTHYIVIFSHKKCDIFYSCFIICMNFFNRANWNRTAFSCLNVLFVEGKFLSFITSVLCYVSSLLIFLLSVFLSSYEVRSLLHILQYFGSHLWGHLSMKKGDFSGFKQTVGANTLFCQDQNSRSMLSFLFKNVFLGMQKQTGKLILR